MNKKQKALTLAGNTVAKTNSLDEFLELCNRQPKKEIIKSFGNDHYVPIRIIEDQLTFLTGGLWEWIIKEQKLIGNSIVTIGDLKIFHPVAKTWLTRSGSGAVPIQLKGGSDPTDMSQIQSKAIHKNAPSSAAFAFRNAAKKFGKIFGSTLNNASDEFIVLNKTIYSETEEKPPAPTEEEFKNFIKADNQYIVNHMADYTFSVEQQAIIDSIIEKAMEE